MTARSIRPEDFRFDPPTLPDEVLASTARDVYGIEGPMRTLRGERDQNRAISPVGGRAVVLKVAGAAEDPSVVDFRLRALLHLAETDPELNVPRVVPTLAGAPLGYLEYDGTTYCVRALTFVAGETFEEATVVAEDVLHQLGEFQGRMCKALSGFEHPAAEHFMPWDLGNGLVADEGLWAGLDEDALPVVGPWRGPLAGRIGERIAALRRQVIHNDAHRGNVIGPPDHSAVTGLIDFGDLVAAPMAADLAVSVSSFVHLATDPVHTATSIARGFHGRMPLSDGEIDALHDLVLTRLVLAVLLLDFQRRNIATTDPTAAGTIATERAEALAGVTRWVSVDPAELADRLRAALADNIPGDPPPDPDTATQKAS